MARDHRILADGSRVDFSCENYRFRTSIARGMPHGQCPTGGSVTGEPLIQTSDGFTLWLEHVESADAGEDGNQLYWLMWYDQNGIPTIPLSSIFDRDQLTEMLRQLLRFIPQ